MSKFRIKLGSEVKDKVTNFAGIVLARCEYATGCDQYLVQPINPPQETGKLPESHWFDDARLSVFKNKPIDIQEIQVPDKNGCDCKSAPKK